MHYQLHTTNAATKFLEWDAHSHRPDVRQRQELTSPPTSNPHALKKAGAFSYCLTIDFILMSFILMGVTAIFPALSIPRAGLRLLNSVSRISFLCFTNEVSWPSRRWASVMERSKAKKMEKNRMPEVLEIEIAVLTELERKK